MPLFESYCHLILVHSDYCSCTVFLRLWRPSFSIRIFLLLIARLQVVYSQNAEMDPLSITVSVATLISTCGRLCWELKQLRSASQMADSKLNSILSEVECFKQLLHQMADTMQSINADESMQDTGHFGNHLRSISVCTADGIVVLERLHETLRSVSKSSRLLDGLRKHFRLLSVSDEISVYQSQIRSYRDTIQLSMQAVIL